MLIYDILWLSSGIAFLTLAVVGLFISHQLGRLLTGIGLLAATLLLAAQGLIVLAKVFWILPAGIYPGLKSHFSGHTMDFPSAWVFVLIWLIYGAALLIYAFARHSMTRRLVWLILVAACLVNVGGCQNLISQLRKLHDREGFEAPPLLLIPYPNRQRAGSSSGISAAGRS